MAVFRVEKTKDFTIMSNHHLRNTELSLKAKGLLSLMLSLPEDWDYTTKGLAHICKDGVDSITTALKERPARQYSTAQSFLFPPPSTVPWKVFLLHGYFSVYYPHILTHSATYMKSEFLSISRPAWKTTAETVQQQP